VNRITDLIECMRVRPLLQAYLDGELDDEQGAALVARHLAACERCGMTADRITALKQHVAQLRREPTPEQIDRIEQVIDRLTDRSAGTDR
jgi:anti-sigma factor RsiW